MDTMIIIRAAAAAVVFLLTGSAASMAQGVNEKNGNMYISYIDVDFKDHPLGFSIERTYNSKSVGAGWFGMGWSSVFETRLLAIPGGGIVICHHGLGSEEVYRPAVWDNRDISLKVNALIEEAQKNFEVKTPEEISEFKNKLLNSESDRMKAWKDYVDKYPGKMLLLSPGTKLISVWNVKSRAEVLGDGYKVPRYDSSYYVFDRQGRLTKVADDKGHEITLAYDQGDKPSVIRDNSGNILTLLFVQGLVKSVSVKYADGKAAASRYEYDYNTRTLSSSTDVAGNYYRHEWDNFYNMTAIFYQDGRDARITYDPQTGFATSVKKKNGAKTLYGYPQRSDDDYGTVITAFDSTGVQVKNISTWYFMKTSSLGRSWQYKQCEVVNNDSTTYIFNERFGLADTVYLNNGLYYSFSYNGRGEVTKISARGLPLLSLVIKNDRISSLTSSKTTYAVVYEGDKVGKLVAADKTELALPLKDLQTDKEGYKADIGNFLPAFKYTVHCAEMHVFSY